MQIRECKRVCWQADSLKAAVPPLYPSRKMRSLLGRDMGKPVRCVGLPTSLLLGKLVNGLAQRSVFLEQMLLSVDDGVSQIPCPDAAASELAAVNPGLGDSLHPQLHRRRKTDPKCPACAGTASHHR